ncbi:MAG: 3-methyladenine DNA glycosylase, partial [Marmoricola sp.]
RRWHPGYGVQLADAPEYDGLKGYQDGTVDPAYAARQRPLVEGIRALLVATLGRPANLGCFGLHEWAMVYRSDASAPTGAMNALRHAWPLRLGGEATDTVVEGHRVGCSHFDAFRFFTEPARPLNVLQPGREDRVSFEQPGCLHAGMDLYKHAFRLSPLIPSELVADAFELAWDIRVLDMRAAPYDFTGVVLEPSGEPWTPVRIETPEGKSAYAAAQRGFSERARPIRERLVAECDRICGKRASEFS